MEGYHFEKPFPTGARGHALAALSLRLTSEECRHGGCSTRYAERKANYRTIPVAERSITSSLRSNPFNQKSSACLRFKPYWTNSICG